MSVVSDNASSDGTAEALAAIGGRRLRLLGLPVLKILTDRRETSVRLFGGIPLVRISRRFRMGS